MWSGKVAPQVVKKKHNKPGSSNRNRKIVSQSQ